MQFANIFLTYQTFVTNLHLLRVQLRCKLQEKLHHVTRPLFAANENWAPIKSFSDFSTKQNNENVQSDLLFSDRKTFGLQCVKMVYHVETD